ncbi:MAG: hypothetical protein O9330_19610 [Beijerinckiaceae bacterium]|nr:hypothetical protein [Beijerinckiaceae bacterium]
MTPIVKARARKVLRLFTDGANAAERGAARLRLVDMAEKAGVPVGDLMAAIGAPRNALDVPHA